jgi:hypothetical protein
LLEELATFCGRTQSMAKQPYDVYNATKAANEAIALWMQREGMTIMASVMRQCGNLAFSLPGLGIAVEITRLTPPSSKLTPPPGKLTPRSGKLTPPVGQINSPAKQTNSPGRAMQRSARYAPAKAP